MPPASAECHRNRSAARARRPRRHGRVSSHGCRNRVMPVTSTARPEATADERRRSTTGVAAATGQDPFGSTRRPAAPPWRGLAICLAYVGRGVLAHPRPVARPGHPRARRSTRRTRRSSSGSWPTTPGCCSATSAWSRDRLNAPDGVNLMVNATIIVLGVLFAPVTAARSARRSRSRCSPPATSPRPRIAWYLLLRRGLGAHRFAAGVARRVLRLRAGHGLAGQQPPAHDRPVARAGDGVVRDPDGPGRRPRPARGRRRAPPAGSSWPRCCSRLLVVLQVFIGEEVALPRRGDAGAVQPGVRRRPTGAGPADRCRGSPAGCWSPRRPPAPCSPTRCGCSSPGRRACPTGCSAPTTSRPTWRASRRSRRCPSPAREEAARLSTGPSEYNTFLGIAADAGRRRAA